MGGSHILGAPPLCSPTGLRPTCFLRASVFQHRFCNKKTFHSCLLVKRSRSTFPTYSLWDLPLGPGVSCAFPPPAQPCTSPVPVC